jgi:hypothetical protein
MGKNNKLNEGGNTYTLRLKIDEVHYSKKKTGIKKIFIVYESVIKNYLFEKLCL